MNTTPIGATVTLECLGVNDCGIVNGKRFIVIKHCNGDRISSTSEILFEDGLTQRFVLDNEDPKVVYLGRGSFKTRVTTSWPNTEVTL